MVSVYRNDAGKEGDSLLLSLSLLCMKIRNNGCFCQYKIWSVYRLWKQFSRVHDVIWIKVLFDAFHQGDFGRGAYFVQPLFFDDTYAVFCGNGTVAGKYVAINRAVDVIFVTICLVTEYIRQKSIVVQAAVA